MKIKAKSSVLGECASWRDLEVVTDEGDPIWEIKSVTMHIKEGDEPIVAILEVYVSEIEIEALEVKP